MQPRHLVSGGFPLGELCHAYHCTQTIFSPDREEHVVLKSWEEMSEASISLQKPPETLCSAVNRHACDDMNRQQSSCSLYTSPGWCPLALALVLVYVNIWTPWYSGELITSALLLSPTVLRGQSQYQIHLGYISEPTIHCVAYESQWHKLLYCCYNWHNSGNTMKFIPAKHLAHSNFLRNFLVSPNVLCMNTYRKWQTQTFCLQLICVKPFCFLFRFDHTNMLFTVAWGKKKNYCGSNIQPGELSM